MKDFLVEVVATFAYPTNEYTSYHQKIEDVEVKNKIIIYYSSRRIKKEDLGKFSKTNDSVNVFLLNPTENDILACKLEMLDILQSFKKKDLEILNVKLRTMEEERRTLLNTMEKRMLE